MKVLLYVLAILFCHSSALTTNNNSVKVLLSNFHKKLDEYYIKIEKEGFGKIAIEKLNKVIENLPKNKNQYQMATSFTSDMVFLNNFYEFATDCLSNPNCPSKDQNRCYESIMNPSSEYRITLSGIANKFILTNPHAPWNSRLFDLMLDTCLWKVSIEPDDFTCYSLRMTIKDVYHMIVVNMLRNYSLTRFVLHRRKQPGTNNIEIELFSNRLKIDLHMISEVALEAMSLASSLIRVGDPLEHQRGKTYERLTNFLQGWVGSEEYLSARNFCGQGCNFHNTSFYDIIVHNRSKVHQFSPALKVTNGTYYRCQRAPYFNTIFKQTHPPDPERLYHHLAFSASDPYHNFGANIFNPAYKYAKFDVMDVAHRDSIHVREDTILLCKICLCYVDHKTATNSVRSFSAVPVTVSAGRVVTGIRWVVRNRVISLELQGHEFDKTKQLPIPSTAQWYAAEDPLQSTIVLDYEHRALSLHDITVPPGMVVTGAKLVVIQDKLICLSVMGAPVDAIHKSNTQLYSWYTPDKNKERREHLLNEPAPSEWAQANTIESNRDQSTGRNLFIKFQPTDFRKDAAQTTVPYLDIQEVITTPPTPLQGIGIYWRGAKGFGGFVALKLLTGVFPNLTCEIRNINESFNLIGSLINTL